MVNNMKHFSWVAGLALISAVFSGCNGNKAEDTATGGGTGGTATTSGGDSGSGARPKVTAPTVAASGDTIKIGIVGSLTGDQKPWGEDSINGAKMAVEEFNAAGGLSGKKIELLVGDSMSKPEQAKSATEKMLSDGAIAIVGEVASGHTIQIAKAAYPKAVPVIAIGATKTTLTDEGENVFRVCYTDDFQGPVMAKFAFDELQLKKVALMTDNKQPYSQGLSKSFADTFKALGGEIVGEVFYESGNTQFTSQVTDLKSKNPEGIMLSGYFTEVGPIAQEIRRQGMQAKLLGGDGWDSPQLLISGGDAIVGSYFCNHYNNKEDRPEVKAFLDKWTKKYGGEPGTTMAALGYDAMGLTLDALKRASAPDSIAIMKAVDESEGYQGVSGVINLKGNGGNPAKRALVVEVRPQSEGFQVFRKAYDPSDLKKP